jgi:hypothetical protein
VYSSLSQSSGDGKSSPHFSISKHKRMYHYKPLSSINALVQYGMRKASPNLQNLILFI